MTYEEVEAFMNSRYNWHVHKDSFRFLSRRLWIAQVTTLFCKARGEEEATFVLLFDQDTRHMMFLDEPAVLMKLKAWIDQFDV